MAVFGGIVYFVAALRGEKWVPLPASKSNTSALKSGGTILQAPKTAPPRLQKNIRREPALDNTGMEVIQSGLKSGSGTPYEVSPAPSGPAPILLKPEVKPRPRPQPKSIVVKQAYQWFVHLQKRNKKEKKSMGEGKGRRARCEILNTIKENNLKKKWQKIDFQFFLFILVSRESAVDPASGDTYYINVNSMVCGLFSDGLKSINYCAASDIKPPIFRRKRLGTSLRTGTWLWPRMNLACEPQLLCGQRA